ADFGNANGNLQLILEAGGCKKFTGGVDARPANLHFLIFSANREADRAEVCVLGLLHPAEKIGKVGDAGKVGFGKLDNARICERCWHIRQKKRSRRLTQMNADRKKLGSIYAGCGVGGDSKGMESGSETL